MAIFAPLHRSGRSSSRPSERQEKVSAVAAQRPEFDRALDYVREGDTLCVTRLDRLARSMADLMSIVGTLERKRVGLRVLSGGAAMDTSTASGRLMLQIFGAVAKFERSLMLERQKAGIAAARAAGRYSGGKVQHGSANSLLKGSAGMRLPERSAVPRSRCGVCSRQLGSAARGSWLVRYVDWCVSALSASPRSAMQPCHPPGECFSHTS